MIVVEIFDRPSVEKGKARSLRRRQVFPELGIYILLDRRTRRFIFDRGNSKLERKTGADQSCRVTASKSKGAWICRNPDEFSRCRFSNVDAVRVSVSGNSAKKWNGGNNSPPIFRAICHCAIPRSSTGYQLKLINNTPR